jgi:membrane glycosyltransferase
MQSQIEQVLGTATGRRPVPMTPGGLQSFDTLARRRWLVVALNVATYAVIMGLAARLLSAGGWTVLDGIMLAAFAIGLPWTVLGFWNAVIGLALLHGTRDPMAHVAPFAAAGGTEVPVVAQTAVLMTLRNEDPERAIRRFRIVQESIEATGQGEAFGYFVLSDTDVAEIAAAEEAMVAAWRAAVPPELAERITYRRRTSNAGFKAGNVRDFCERWGQNYELMLPLDADSVMSGPAIVRLVRMIQAHPRIGILQSLVVGMPSHSAFARVFQFGMRHGMRPYTMGQAWWVGECGPYWGHNALVRIRPFHEHCGLSELPGRPPLGGPVLSHDQVEATFMRRAGFEVRVLPQENGSWEENPPTILDFMQRDVRWCQGNMQYTKMLDEPGLFAMSRFQLVWAVLMFVGIPAWTMMIALLPFYALEARDLADFPAGLAIGLYLAFLAMYLTPKLAGLIDTVLSRGGVASYGGWLRFAAGTLIEFVFSFLQGAISTIRTTLFMIGLLFGVRVDWGGQARDTHGLSWRQAVVALWPQTAFGLFVAGALLWIAPTVFWWSLPLTIGYVLAVPFAVLTASPALGRWMKRCGIAGIPEDFDPPAEIRSAQAVAG